MTTIYNKFNAATAAFLNDLKITSKSAATHEKYSVVLCEFGEWLMLYPEQDGEEITPMMIVGWKQHEINDREVSSNTLRHYLIVLRAFFNWTIDKKIFTEQPIKNNDLPKKSKVKLDLLTNEEIETILSGRLPLYIHKNIAMRTRAMIILFLQTGLRVSELINLRVRDLDFKNGQVRVIDGKGDKCRSTTFPREAREFVKEYLNWQETANSGGLAAIYEGYGVYSAPDGSYHYNADGLNSRIKGDSFVFEGLERHNATRLVKTYVKHLIGKEGIGAHDLRHAYASYILTHGEKLENIQQLLGHSNYATTVLYAAQLCPEKIPANTNAIFDNRELTAV